MCARERDPALNTHSITIINQCGDETTHTILTHSSEETHNWMEAFWQHFYDMSEYQSSENAQDHSTVFADFLIVGNEKRNSLFDMCGIQITSTPICCVCVFAAVIDEHTLKDASQVPTGLILKLRWDPRPVRFP